MVDVVLVVGCKDLYFLGVRVWLFWCVDVVWVVDDYVGYV